MNATQIVYLVLAAVLLLIWLGLAVRGPRKVESSNVTGVLRYGSALRCLALVLALLPPMIALYAIWGFLWRSDAMLIIGGASFLASSVIAGLPLIEVTRVQIVLTEDGITRYSPWARPTTLKWQDVERIGYSTVNRWFIVQGAGHTIRVSRHLEGLGIFVDAVRRKVAPDRRASVAGVLDHV